MKLNENYFRLEESYLFSTIAHKVNAYAQAAGFQRDDYIQPALEAGQLEGEQYILPLSVSIPLFVGGKDAVEKSGFDAEAAAANQTAFFDELSRALNESGARVLYTLSLTNLLQQPLIDYAAGVSLR